MKCRTVWSAVVVSAQRTLHLHTLYISRAISQRGTEGGTEETKYKDTITCNQPGKRNQ